MGFFVRYDPWCRKCLASLDYFGGKTEKGLSVFECDQLADGTWRLRGEAWTNKAKTLHKSDGHWSLLHGTEFRKGADGEPVLSTTFKFKKKLEPTMDESVFRQVEGGEPPAFVHDNHCEPPPREQTYLEAQENMYGPDGDDDAMDDDVDDVISSGVDREDF
ncbi:MAG TPA: hypothetical protein VGL81_31805 [Polyangiaceae bacterium]|jgi:hypothetical protein